MSRRPGRIERPLIAIIAEGFLSRLSFGLISFALPLYAYHLGLSLPQIGLLASLNLVVAIVLKPAMGWVADRWGLKPSLMAAMTARTLVTFLLIVAAAPWQLFVIRILHGCSIALRDPSVNALIAEHGGKKRIASAFAWYQTAKSVAGAAGKATAGVLLALSGGDFSFVFAVAFVLSALPLEVVRRFVQDTKHPLVERGDTSQDVSSIEGGTERPLEQLKPSTIPFLVLGFLISGSAAMLGNLFPILATEYAGLTTAQAGMVYAVATVFIFTGPLWGWISDHVSHRLVFLVRSASNTISSLVYLFAPNFAGVLAGRSLDDMGKAAFRPAWGALMARVASYDRRRRARTMSIMTMGEDAGEVVGPILAGLLWGWWGAGALLVTRATIAVATELYSVHISRALDTLPALDGDRGRDSNEEEVRSPTHQGESALR